MKTSYSIGEFSQITGLTAKTLRFYHEKGILVPTSVDETTGYRFYDADKIEKARIIMRLRQMEFSIEDIATVFGACGDDADILNHLERQKQFLQQRISEDRDIVRSLSEIIAKEKEAKQLLESGNFAVEENPSALTFRESRAACMTTASIEKTTRTSSLAFRSANESRPRESPFVNCRARDACRFCIAAPTTSWAAAMRRF